MTAATDTATLRAELTRRLAPHLPAAAVAPVADAAVVALAAWTGDRDEVLPRYVYECALQAVPQPYRTAVEVAAALAVGVAAWWDSRVVEVEAGSVTVRDRRG